VNLDETHKVISNLVRDGVSGLVVCSSVGKNTSLTIEEKMAVTEVAKDASGGRVPVICGIAEFTSAGAAKVARAEEQVAPTASTWNASWPRPWPTVRTCRTWVSEASAATAAVRATSFCTALMPPDGFMGCSGPVLLSLEWPTPFCGSGDT
jgi:predicted membrane-bound mannosyltransferase